MEMDNLLLYSYLVCIFVCEVKPVCWVMNGIYIYFLNHSIRFLCILPIPVFSDEKRKN